MKLATSSGVPKRPMGMLLAMLLRASWGRTSLREVSSVPGQTQLTLMLWREISREEDGGHGVDGSVGRGVGGGVREEVLGEDGGDVDDLAPALAHHMGDNCLAAEVGAENFDVHDGAEDVFGEVNEGTAVGTSGGGCVVDEDVYAAELAEGVLDHGGDAGCAGDVDHEGQGAATLGADGVGNAFDAAPTHFLFLRREGGGVAAGAGDHHVATGLG